MKKILFLLLILYVSCNSDKKLSESDLNKIRMNIALHNSNWGLKQDLNSIKREEVRTITGIAKNDSNKMSLPYSPNIDTDLTEEELFDYCKKNNLDPLEYSNILGKDK